MLRMDCFEQTATHEIVEVETSALATLGTMLCLLLCARQYGRQLKGVAQL